MENNNTQNENGQVENNNINNDSDLYANPFSNPNENDNLNNEQNIEKENGINKNIDNPEENQNKLDENIKPEEEEHDKDKIIENNKDIKTENINGNLVPLKSDNTNPNEKINLPEKKLKNFIIKETGSNIYIENTKKIMTMAIEKSLNKLYILKDINEMLNINIIKSYSVDAVLGIIDINGNNKYILVVYSSKLIANIIGSDIYNILDVDFIKITLFDETENERKRMLGVKKLFQSKNFYYSKTIDLCQNLFIKNRKNVINDFCINSSLLKLFFDNFIPSDFYTKVIYGYIGFKQNTEIKNEKNMVLVDNLIIERVNKHLKFNSDIVNQMKQIEFISMYKQHNMNTQNKNKYNINIFTFIFYVSSEIANNKVPFNPWNNFIMNELSQYPNIVCIINNNININLDNNININNNSIKNIIFNSNKFGSKIKLLNFTSDWKKNLFFDNNINSNEFIKSGSIHPNLIQDYIFWFIDINNQFNESDFCFNTIIRLMWKSMQQQIDFMNLGISIGQFNKKNNEIIIIKFKELIMNYHNDLDINKKPIYKSQMRKQLQKVFDYYFNNYNKLNSSKINIYESNYYNNNNPQNNNQAINFNDSSNFNKNNLNAYQNVNINQNNNNFANPFLQNKDNQKNQNFKASTQIISSKHRNNNMNLNNPSYPKKLNILCITWNVGGISSELKYDIRDLFTQNIFYNNNRIPDIIIIGLQEIVELDIYNILSITTNEDSVSDWTKNIISTVNSIYPYTFEKISTQNLVGIYCLCLAQSHLKDRIEIIGKNVIKTGFFGTLGNKGYLTLNLKLFKSIEISFAVGHLEAGKDSNEQRIAGLKQILNTKINDYENDDIPNGEKKFKNSDFWIILGDLNFRIETYFEKSFQMIQRKEYEQLMEFDQLYLSRLKDGGLVDINEAQIKFPPTYKYISGSNNYVNDNENLRTPSWTDRILFCHKNSIRNLNYSSIPSIMYSDHRPVQASFEIDMNQNNRIANAYSNNNMNLFRNNIFNNNEYYNNYGNNKNNNTYIGNNNYNYNFNNQNNFSNNDNFKGFTNNFQNNYNNNPFNRNWNNNNYNNINGARNFNHPNNNKSNLNYNNNANNGSNHSNNNINKKNQMNQKNNIYQRTNSSDKKINKPNNYNIINKNQTIAFFNKKDTNNKKNNDDNDNDNDNIENIMKFFK